MSHRLSAINQEVDIQCVGYSVKAELYEGSADRAVLVLIGFTSEKDKYQNLANSIVAQTRSTVLVLNYSGHGESPFDIQDIMPAQNFLEAITAFDWLKEKYPQAKITVIGTSYGGFMATQLTEYRSFEQLILRVPALYEPDNFYTRWRDSNIEKRHEYRLHAPDLDQHPLLKRARDFKGRTLVILHENDEVCPIHSTQPFINAFKADSWIAPRLRHSFWGSNISETEEANYNKQITDWMKR